jgi:hypothetical protein
MNISTIYVHEQNTAENRKYKRKHRKYRSRPRFLHILSNISFSHTKYLLFSNLKFNKHSSCAATKEVPLIQWNPKSSLPCSQELATSPHPEPDESSTHVYHVSRTYFNIVSPTMSRVLLWSVLSRHF